MKEISNTDYEKIIRNLPILLDKISQKDNLRISEIVRQFRVMLKKWKRINEKTNT